MADDTTYIEGPDTPAPMFAIRAFQSLWYGSQPSKPTAKSPVKPAGILLTPGTATRRRKSVTFGNDVVDKAPTPTPWKDDDDDGTPKVRPRTKLTAALENSRKKPSPKQEPKPEVRPDPKPTIEDDPAWEEVDDLDGDPDVTIDLNDPRSQSGKYWQSQLKNYQEEAKEEMGVLLRYKHLAKSYAKLKDTEALEVKQKNAEMEEKMSAMETKMTAMEKKMAALERENRSLRAELAVVKKGRQTEVSQGQEYQSPQEIALRRLAKTATPSKAKRPEVVKVEEKHLEEEKAPRRPARTTTVSDEKHQGAGEGKENQPVAEKSPRRPARTGTGYTGRQLEERVLRSQATRAVAVDSELQIKGQAYQRPPGRAAAARARLELKRAERAREILRMKEEGLLS